MDVMMLIDRRSSRKRSYLVYMKALLKWKVRTFPGLFLLRYHMALRANMRLDEAFLKVFSY
jgi:hypothetical protein